MVARLSRTIQAIHYAARNAPANGFKDRVLGLAREVLPFDSGLWAEAPPGSALSPDRPIHLANQPWEMMESYFHLIGDADPMVALADTAPGRSLNLFDAFPREEWIETGTYREHGRPFGLEQTLTTATPYPSAGVNAYLSLYRNSAQTPFTETERRIKEVLTPHLVEAHQTVLVRELAEIALRPAPGRGFALTDREGRVRQRTSRFPALLHSRYPQWRGPLLPAPLRHHLPGPATMDLGALQVTAQPRPNGLVLLVAEARGPLHRLTPAERRVARQLAAGHSHKSAARALERSPSTIRNQANRLYAKLGVRNKADLARLLAAGGEEGAP